MTLYVCRNRSFQTVNVCKTELWVIQQNRKYLLEFHFRLGDPPEYYFRPGKLPEYYYIRTGTKTSRLLQLDQKSTPDFRSIPTTQTGYSNQKDKSP